MPRSPVPFHVQHIARPEHIKHILEITSDDYPIEATSIRQRLIQDGYAITQDAVRRSLDWGSKLGLFNKETSTDRKTRLTYVLTTRGQACRNLALFRHEVYCDVIHFLSFAAWERGGKQDYWSWSYGKICEILWETRPRIEKRKAIFGQLSAEATRMFPHLDPVVGTETIGAVSNWLKELSPPFLVVEDDRIIGTRERDWFSVELALLAVSYLYAADDLAVRTPILLDSPTIQRLCPLCLAPAERVIVMIETAARTFPILEIHTGEWGSSAVLQQTIGIEMLT